MLPDLLRLATEAAEVGCWEYDLVTLELEWDRRCRLLFGLSVDATISYESFRDLVHPEDSVRVDDAVEEAIANASPYCIEFRTRAETDGAPVWISARGSALYDDAGKPLRFLGVMVVVTARHSVLEQREALIRKREEASAILDTLLDGAPVGIGFWDSQLRFVRVNRCLAEMNGMPEGEHFGKTLAELSPNVEPRLVKALEHVRDTGEPVSLEIDGGSSPRHGVPRQWKANYYPVRAHDRIVGVGAICGEITEQRFAERQIAGAHQRERAARAEAERLNRMKDEFLSTVSHELRTPLQSILGWARTLREGGLEPEQIDHGIEIIERNSHAQVRIIEDILDVSRIISGKLRIARQSVSLVRTVELALDAIRPAALAKGIELTALLPSDLEPIIADEDRLQQVLWNLLSNAVKFTSSGGAVSVSVRQTEQIVEIRVTDSGQGIRANFLPYVFDRFRQQDGGTTRSQGGLGLGLAIVRHLIEMHGGTVAAESEGEGKGATFVVQLPARAPRGEDELDSIAPGHEVQGVRSVPAKPLEGISVLVADDEADARELLAIVLRRNGALPRVVGSVQEALRAVAETRFDVVVSDIGMPGEDGYVLARALRDHPNRPRAALALTAYARNEDRRAALRAGFDGHVAKPIDPTELVAVIAHMLESEIEPRTT